jgi:hypothetical protein
VDEMGEEQDVALNVEESDAFGIVNLWPRRA